jgi:hypothetical protein
MPVKRRTPKSRHAHFITSEAIDAFRRSDWIGLHRAAGLKPWQTSPLDVDEGEMPDGYDPAQWVQALALRRALEAAGREN